ncbi:MAG TPA: glycosyltransferase family 4 protein [Methanocellales archaeon]|nr:glycosyltransferase family 4 protein [Methanocellales archaeon]
MKIVYLATSTIPSRTANSIHVMKMCQALAKKGHEVILIVPNRHDGEEPGIEDVFDFYGIDKCFKIILLPVLSIKGRGIIFGFQAGKKTKELQPNIVYGRDLLASYFASLLKLPVIFESHAPIEGFIYGNVLNRLLQRPELMKLVVITHALKEYYSINYPFISDRIIVAPDGADPLSDNATPVVLPNKGKRLQVGYVGHLYSGRGVDVIHQFAERCPWADFHIVGGTDKDINDYRMSTTPLANLHIHGFKPHTEAERYRIGCDVLIAPYQKKVSVGGNSVNTTEKWMSPLKIFEYMAAGKAIICSDIHVLREVLVDGRNAILCDPEDVESWVEALVILSKKKEYRTLLGENARNELISNYSWSSRANKLLGALNAMNTEVSELKHDAK